MGLDRTRRLARRHCSPLRLPVLGLVRRAGSRVGRARAVVVATIRRRHFGRPVEAFDSAYCVTARKWAVHELNGGGDWGSTLAAVPPH